MILTHAKNPADNGRSKAIRCSDQTRSGEFDDTPLLGPLHMEAGLPVPRGMSYDAFSHTAGSPASTDQGPSKLGPYRDGSTTRV